jgi:hypothetical protein
VAAIAVLGALATLGLWLLLGGRLYVVETSSMGTRAPGGSLVVVSPTSVSDLRVGDVVSVRPQGRAAVWTHEVAAIHADGTIATRGRISGPDPWRIGEGQLVGRGHVVPGLGWLVKAGPLLLGAGLLVAFLVRRSPRSWRRPLGVAGAALALALAVVVYQPFQGADELQLAAQDGGAVGAWVNTGLLPLRLAPLNGDPGQVIGTGEVARFRFSHPAPGGRYGVRLTPVAPWLMWVLIVGGCLVPAALETARRLPAVTESPQSSTR